MRILVKTRTAGLLGPHLGSAITRNLHTGTACRDLRVPEVGKPPDRMGTVFPAAEECEQYQSGICQRMEKSRNNWVLD